MLKRILGSCLLFSEIYREVATDRSAMPQALCVVILMAICTAVGVGWGIGEMIYFVAICVVAWGLLALTIYLFGTTLFRTQETAADWGQLARTLGFAQSPGILKVLGILPQIGPAILISVSIWQVVTVIVAVRASLGYKSFVRATIVSLTGSIPTILLLVWAIR